MISAWMRFSNSIHCSLLANQPDIKSGLWSDINTNPQQHARQSWIPDKYPAFHVTTLRFAHLRRQISSLIKVNTKAGQGNSRPNNQRPANHPARPCPGAPQSRSRAPARHPDRKSSGSTTIFGQMRSQPQATARTTAETVQGLVGAAIKTAPRKTYSIAGTTR